jgi:hypothetical protein
MNLANNSFKNFLYSGLIVLLAVSCSHKYNSDELDLGFYQWNMWPDTQTREDGLPSCGWEVLHRGNGALVRIPAQVDEHFGAEEISGTTWFHCRFTLPEMWEHRQIILKFEGISHPARIYLNELLVGSYTREASAFELDVTESIYYVRDNHLAIRITDPDQLSGGITGTIWVSSSVVPQDLQD